MCGIAGIVTANARAEVSTLETMLSAIRHRGPDGSGTSYFANCALGHRRLAIVDLESGAQPMLTADGQTAITFNGEIYGYRELRRELADYPYRTESDTEVILALYERHGENLVKYLPGMFAFAIWDEKRQRLFCARDRFGEKPLYYALTKSGQLVFASELKAILASGLVQPILSAASLSHYVRRLYVHPHRTIFENIHVVPPAHCMAFEAGRVTTWRYWSLPQSTAQLSLDEAAEQFRSLLLRATRKQLIADVPVGAFLSGGLDSTSVVYAAQQADAGIATYSFDFTGRHTESGFARAAAAQYGTRHFELTPPSTRIADVALRMAEVYDEPFGDSSNIPTYLLAQEARKHVTVVLTGDGADELLGGYDWYKPLAYMSEAQDATWLKHFMARAASRVARSMGSSNQHVLERRALGMGYALRSPSVAHAHVDQLQLLSSAEVTSLGLPPGDSAQAHELMNGSSGLDAAMRLDLLDYMPGDILVKIDRAAMAHGLELRAPFLDVELAEFCLSLPASLKVTTQSDKILMRRAMAEYWPESIRTRTKQGFGAPMEEWLNEPGMRELSHDYLEARSSPLFNVLRPEAVAAVLAKGVPIQRWALLGLGLWLGRQS